MAYSRAVDHATFVQAIETHSDALREAAIAAGPDAQVPSCPRWTVRRLVRHTARVHSLAVAGAHDPSGENARAAAAPEEWAALLSWWDSQRAALRRIFAGDPAAPAHLPFPAYAQTVASWARRLAHETAIHRLDAELAAGKDTVTFDREFAADGIDELLTMVLHRRTDWTATTADGTVLVYADDAARLWSVRVAPGTAPRLAEEAFEPGVTVEGSADAVYRALWGRPSTAKITGDATLLDPLAAP